MKLHPHKIVQELMEASFINYNMKVYKKIRCEECKDELKTEKDVVHMIELLLGNNKTQWLTNTLLDHMIKETAVECSEGHGGASRTITLNPREKPLVLILPKIDTNKRKRVTKTLNTMKLTIKHNDYALSVLITLEGNATSAGPFQAIIRSHDKRFLVVKEDKLNAVESSDVVNAEAVLAVYTEVEQPPI